jgi:Flp pilus assembly pilin Flp
VNNTRKRREHPGKHETRRRIDMVELMNRALTRAMIAAGDLNRLVKGERGQDLLEYALIGGVMAAFIVGLGALLVANGALDGMATGIKNCIDFDDVCP